MENAPTAKGHSQKALLGVTDDLTYFKSQERSQEVPATSILSIGVIAQF